MVKSLGPGFHGKEQGHFSVIFRPTVYIEVKSSVKIAFISKFLCGMARVRINEWGRSLPQVDSTLCHPPPRRTDFYPGGRWLIEGTQTYDFPLILTLSHLTRCIQSLYLSVAETHLNMISFLSSHDDLNFSCSI